MHGRVTTHTSTCVLLKRHAPHPRTERAPETPHRQSLPVQQLATSKRLERRWPVVHGHRMGSSRKINNMPKQHAAPAPARLGPHDKTPSPPAANTSGCVVPPRLTYARLLQQQTKPAQTDRAPSPPSQAPGNGMLVGACAATAMPCCMAAASCENNCT